MLIIRTNLYGFKWIFLFYNSYLFNDLSHMIASVHI